MAGFRLRFRKSIPIIPKILYVTLNKKSYSINLRLGPYSRSWGNKRSHSTLDMPGELGFSYRKSKERPGVTDYTPIWALLAIIITFSLLVVSLIAAYLPLTRGCHVDGQPALAALLAWAVIAVSAKVIWWSGGRRRGVLMTVGLLTAGLAATWFLSGALAATQLTCS